MENKDRVIFHCDCNSFFASVEETFHPEYKKVPMAVAGDPENRRGVILAKNELAKGFGIVTAETVWSAKRKCPVLVLCPPRRHAYGEFCERINSIYEQYTEQTERFGIDESFLDVTGSLHLFGGDPVKLAHEIRERVARETGVTISVGVSWNRMFAKLGSDLKKPNAVTVISRENYKEVVWRLPVRDLFLVGKNTAAVLEKNSIRTIGDLANADAEFLKRILGKAGEQLHINANGSDDSPVARIGEHDPMKSVGNGLTFWRDLVTVEDIRTGVTALADSVASRMRRADVKCNTVQVTIKDPQLKSIQRQKPTSNPTYLAADISKIALEIIESAWKIGKPVRMLTVTAQNLIPASQDIGAEQLSLFEEPDNENKYGKAEKIEKAMDAIRGKYGSHSVLRGNVLKNDLGISDRDEKD